jgi:hypothetical protein
MEANRSTFEIYDGDVCLGTVYLSSLVQAGYYEEIPEPSRVVGTATGNFFPEQVVEVDLVEGKIRNIFHNEKSYGICRMTMGERCKVGDSLTVSSVTGKLICA